MKVSNGVIYSSQQNLIKIARLDYPGLTSLKIKKFMDKYSAELKTIDSVRTEIIKRNGELDKKTNQFVVKKAKEESTIKEINELFESEIELKDFGLKLSSFINQTISAADIEVLLQFFDNDVESDK